MSVSAVLSLAAGVGLVEIKDDQQPQSVTGSPPLEEAAQA